MGCILLRKSGEPLKDGAGCGSSGNTELSQLPTQPLAGCVAWAQHVPALGPGHHIYMVDGNHRACLTSAIQRSISQAGLRTCFSARKLPESSVLSSEEQGFIHLAWLGSGDELCEEEQTRS